MMKYANRCKPKPSMRAFCNSDAIHKGLDKIQLFFTGETRAKPKVSFLNPFAGFISKFLNNKGK